MQNQSNYVYHIYMNSLEELPYEYDLDTRSKIEDVDKFKREVRNILDKDTFKQLDTFIDNYLKFEND